MRIGMMLRVYNETGGIGVYTKNIIKELLELDQDNDYILFYHDKKNLGSYAKYTNVREVFVNCSNKALWDQVAFPLAARREKIDLIFNPKFTIPLFTKAKCIMVTHGADWYIPPYSSVYGAIDTLYIKTFMPLYFRKCSFVSSVSDYSTDNFKRALPKYADKVKTIYFGPNEVFRKVDDIDELNRVKTQYNLPEKFFLSVIRYDEGTKNTRKNFGGMAKAVAKCKREGNLTHKWVVAGKNCHKYGEEHNIEAMGIKDDVIFPGLIPQADLPSFYSLASLYLYPTIIEAFPIPITEAMTCGCPIITSNSTGCDELGANVAFKVDPTSTEEIANAIVEVLGDDALRQEMMRKGLERSKIFSWKKCARETLDAFERVYRG